MTVTVRLFGAEAQAAGCDELVLQLPGDRSTCAAVREAIIQRFPKLSAATRHARLAVNYDYADDGRTVAPGDEVALIGMVSGG